MKDLYWYILLFNHITLTAVMQLFFILGIRSLRYQGTIPKCLWRLGVAFFFFVDAAYDWVYGSLFFLEEPQELTFTQRVSRHAKGRDGWRKSFALWIQKWFFEPFDKDHCNTADRKYWR